MTLLREVTFPMHSTQSALSGLPAPLRRIAPLFLLLALSLAGCATGNQGDFVWANDYKAPPTALDEGYTVGAGDMLNIQVWDNDKLSTRGRVRTDGKISMPLLNEIVVVGKPPTQVAREIEKQLRDANLVMNARVSVLVEDVQGVKVSVLGRVTHPGTYPMEPGAGVAEAIASAGGLTDFANEDQIFVLRRTPQQIRIRFTFGELTAKGPAAMFRLRNGDVVVAN
jgi:polysaccharide biosynthesis/export protein